MAAPYTLAFLSSLGSNGWYAASREHGTLRSQQLFYARLLEVLAPQLQPLDRSVRYKLAHAAPQFINFIQIHLHSSRRFEAPDPRDGSGIHIYRTLARP